MDDISHIFALILLFSNWDNRHTRKAVRSSLSSLERGPLQFSFSVSLDPCYLFCCLFYACPNSKNEVIYSVCQKSYDLKNGCFKDQCMHDYIYIIYYTSVFRNMYSVLSYYKICCCLLCFGVLLLFAREFRTFLQGFVMHHFSCENALRIIN